MAARSGITVAQHLRDIPASTRPMVRAVRQAVKAIAPAAEEVPYQSTRPSSPSTMWKLAKYTAGGEDVCGVGVFSAHANLYFYRGRELSDPRKLLAGSGKEMRSVTLRTAADVESPAVKALLRQAFRLAPRPR